ncbi:hypothetical protein E2C01_002837 [Portunus trituberculatus]|uniref:Uncharacterized protein n=1 Tax=Portunus trituberculatus TaxID=210409 RepID=A0A5B7CLT3_PORTR|nr:hypothetical protein [Portunus trituberculatus]
MSTGDLSSSPVLPTDDEVVEVLEEEEEEERTLPLTSAPAKAMSASAASADSPNPSSRSLFSSAVSVWEKIKEGILGMAALKPRPRDPSESSPKPSRVSSNEEIELIFSILVWGPATVSALFSRTTLWACGSRQVSKALYTIWMAQIKLTKGLFSPHLYSVHFSKAGILNKGLKDSTAKIQRSQHMRCLTLNFLSCSSHHASNVLKAVASIMRLLKSRFRMFFSSSMTVSSTALTKTHIHMHKVKRYPNINKAKDASSFDSY